MESLGIRTTGGITANTIRVVNRVKLSGRVTFPAKQPGKCSPSPTLTVKCAKIETTNGNSNIKNNPEKFDRWIKESVEEIVKNLQEAPLFVHVYGGDGTHTRLKSEKAVPEEWAYLKDKWVKGEEPSPEGIILVEELKEGEIGIYEENEGQNGESSKAWGVLIQGKGENESVGCYLLKTSRVGCRHLGLISTHYCLVKVTSFKESARSQLTKCWLA